MRIICLTLDLQSDIQKVIDCIVYNAFSTLTIYNQTMQQIDIIY